MSIIRMKAASTTSLTMHHGVVGTLFLLSSELLWRDAGAEVVPADNNSTLGHN